MASQRYSQVVIKDEILDCYNLPPENETLCTSVDTTDSYKDLKVSFLNAIKEEEGNAVVPHLEPLHPTNLIGTVSTPPVSPCPKLCTFLVKRPEDTAREFGVTRDILMVRKLLQSTLPKKHVSSRWSKQTTESILRFLRSFATIARGSCLTHCGDKCLALEGPQILKCEECSLEFSGLYDRYLKLFMHYKTDHKLKSNALIGRKWIKQRASLDFMFEAWKMDLKYELQNSCCTNISDRLGLRPPVSSRLKK